HVPQGDKDIGIDGGRHLKSMWLRLFDVISHYDRESRCSHRLMAFLPDGIPGLPMPAYLANTLSLSLRTGRICTPLLSLSKSNRSPSRTPRSRRTSMGTVICPLLVILAPFSKSARRGAPPFTAVFRCRTGHGDEPRPWERTIRLHHGPFLDLAGCFY